MASVRSLSVGSGNHAGQTDAELALIHVTGPVEGPLAGRTTESAGSPRHRPGSGPVVQAWADQAAHVDTGHRERVAVGRGQLLDNSSDASMIFKGDLVGMTRFSFKPCWCSSKLNSFSVLSLPPIITCMCRS